MKKILIAAAFIVTSLGIYAQEPMGGGGFGGGRPPMGNFNGMDDEEDEATEVVKFPEIPNLTDKQREKVIAAVVKEHDGIAKLEVQKRTLFSKNMKFDKKAERPQGAPNGQPNRPGNDSIQGKMPPRPEGQMQANGQRPQGGPQMKGGQPPHPKLSAKDQKKLDKIEKNEAKVSAKADKKISSILTKDQYAVFKDKKKEIKFNSPSNNKQRQGNQQQRMNDNGGGGTPPDMPMGGGGGDF